MGSCANKEVLQKELEEELVDVGERLLRFPSSNDELLILLEEAESILVRVPQELVRSKANSVIPLMTAMIADKLFRNADLNIQVAVASCLNEITRITAPTFPYSDNKMKGIFELFVVALKELSSEPGSNYARSYRILETLASVRSCLIMLDIEIDALIVELFQLFLNTIKSSHSCNIYKNMETIMTTIIEESDEVLLELLKALLDSVRMDNRNISPISWELGKTVFEKCSTRLAPYLREAVKYLDLQVGDYAEIVASICDVTSSKQNMGATTHLSGDGVSKLDMIYESEEENCTHKPKNINGLDNKNLSEYSAEVVPLKSNHTNSDIEVVKSAEILQSEKDIGTQERKRGKKPNSLMRPEEGYEHIWTRDGLGNNQEMELVQAVEAENVNVPISDSSQRKSGSVKKATSGKRGRPKKQESISRGLNSKGEDESSDVAYKEMELVLALEAGNVNVPISDSSQRKSGSVKKETSGKRGRPKKQESSSRGLNSKEKDESSDVAFKTPKRPRVGNGKELVDCGEEMVNSRILIWWPLDKVFYSGTVEAFDPLTKKHTIKYDDDEKEVLNLREERWKLFNKQPRRLKSSQKQEADDPSSASEPVKKVEICSAQKNIAKIKSGSSKKQQAALSPQRSKKEGIFLVKDEDAETCEIDFSLKFCSGEKVSRAGGKLQVSDD